MNPMSPNVSTVSLQIREYVEALKLAQSQNPGAAEADSRLNHWITWALKQADMLDPINRRLAHS